jgi:predicted transcriptional regulator
MTKTMISARIPEKLGNEIEALAESTRRSKAFVITEALEDYVKRRAWQMKRIDDAVREADKSGEYISHEKMEAWMLSLGSPNELPPPQPDIHKKRP